jgi:predicted aldo/keto reductase-like oxidoreductase
MNQRALGKTGLTVSRLCFGTLTVSPLQAYRTPEQAAGLLEYAYNRGINILDTAEYYKNFPQIKAAQTCAGGMKIITKCHAYDEAGAAKSLQKALESTGRDCIDIMLLHEQESEWTIRGHGHALAYFYRQKEKGVIKAVGLSTHFAACARVAAELESIDVIESICNPKGLGIPDGTQQDMNDALALAHANGKGIIAMKALGGGHYGGDARRSIETVLSWPFVDTLAIGMQTFDEIDYNVALADGRVRLDLENDLFGQPRALHIADWCQACGACAERCQAGALSIQNGRMVVDETRCVLCGYCAGACREFCIKVY